MGGWVIGVVCVCVRVQWEGVRVHPHLSFDTIIQLLLASLTSQVSIKAV